MKERKLGLLGKKIGMTTVYDARGEAVGVTVVQLGPCVVLQKRSRDTNEKGRTDGYVALQLGFDDKLERKVAKAEEGHLKKAGGNSKARRYVKEVRVSAETAGKFEVGAELTLQDLGLQPGDKVDVVGRSIGKGFAGVIKRHHFAGFHATHDAETFRHGGSIGNRKFPGRVFKGRRMAGHMGDERVTMQNLKVVGVRTEDNVVLLAGSVPGAKNGYVVVRPAIKFNPGA